MNLKQIIKEEVAGVRIALQRILNEDAPEINYEEFDATEWVNNHRAEIVELGKQNIALGEIMDQLDIPEECVDEDVLQVEKALTKFMMMMEMNLMKN